MVEGQLPVLVNFFKVLFGTLWSWFYLEKQKETKFKLQTAVKDQKCLFKS